MSSNNGWSGDRKTLVNTARKCIEAQGYSIERMPGRGLTAIWRISKDGEEKLASIRTTQDRDIAFPPLEGVQNGRRLMMSIW